jgi:hypothetical protein
MKAMDAAEYAYKNGYEKGYLDGMRDSIKPKNPKVKISRLNRVLNLFDRYDRLAQAGAESHNSMYARLLLNELRAERDQLECELRAYGCRRER